MYRVSLIVATLGERAEELTTLLNSLVPQAEYISNIVVVDQNPDPKVVPSILWNFRTVFSIHHTRCKPGLSRARNHGLNLATGSLIAFPDDDCSYPPGLLEWVVNWFESNIQYDILAVGVKDASGISSGNRWLQDTCEIRPHNAFRTTFSSSLFLWRDLALTAQFDVNLGVGSGTPYGSGEETDYVLRLLRDRARGRFDRTRHVVHPRRDMLSGNSSASRGKAYGFGMGHLLRRHSLRALWLNFLAYNTVRAAIALCRGNWDGARLCSAQTKGLWAGFLDPNTTAKQGGPLPVVLRHSQGNSRLLSPVEQHGVSRPFVVKTKGRREEGTDASITSMIQ
jgi:glycosyltransferase involved in cell wall biosynthesis